MSKYELHNSFVQINHAYFSSADRPLAQNFGVIPNRPQKVSADLIGGITKENSKTNVDPETGRKVGWIALGDIDNKPSVVIMQNWSVDPTQNPNFAYSLAQFHAQVAHEHSVIAVSTPGMGASERLPRSHIRKMRTEGSFLPLGAMVARGLPQSLRDGVHTILGRSQGGRSAVATAAYGVDQGLFPELIHILADDAPTRRFKGVLDIAIALQAKEGPQLKEYVAATNDPQYLESFNATNPAKNIRQAISGLGAMLMTPELLWSLPKALATGLPAVEENSPMHGAFGSELELAAKQGRAAITLALGTESALADVKTALALAEHIGKNSASGIAIATYNGSHALGEYGPTITAPLYSRLMAATSHAMLIT